MSGSGIEMVTEPTSKYSVVSKLLGKMVLCHWIKPELKTQTGIILNEKGLPSYNKVRGLTITEVRQSFLGKLMVLVQKKL